MRKVFNQDFIDFFKALDHAKVRYMLVGGYAVVLHGYHRTTGDLEIWVEQTQENYQRLLSAFKEFGIPGGAISEGDFLSNSGLDVFTFGRPPVAIDIMTSVKGIDFAKAFASSGSIEAQGVKVWLLNLNALITAKKASGRHKDLDDIQHLTKEK